MSELAVLARCGLVNASMPSVSRGPARLARPMGMMEPGLLWPEARRSDAVDWRFGEAAAGDAEAAAAAADDVETSFLRMFLNLLSRPPDLAARRGCDEAAPSGRRRAGIGLAVFFAALPVDPRRLLLGGGARAASVDAPPSIPLLLAAAAADSSSSLMSISLISSGSAGSTRRSLPLSLCDMVVSTRCARRGYEWLRREGEKGDGDRRRLLSLSI